jgi:hypothetical protein
VRRLTILIAAVGALLLVPAASAFAAGETFVEVVGTGNGEVSSVGGIFGSGEYEGAPPIECSYASPGPATGTCEDAMTEYEPGLWAIGLHEVAAPGSEFGGWIVEEGGFFFGCEEEAECPILTEVGGSSGEDAVVTAIFICEEEIEEGEECGGGGEETPNLKVNIEEGSGTVVSSPAGIECGGKCEAEFEEGGKVTLTASPAPGYLFKSWKKCDTGGVNGRQCTITATSSLKEVGAKFVKVWNVSASKAGSGIGKIQTSPGGILCLYNCSEAEAAFKEGSVTVKQAAAKHNHFVQWLGDCSGSEPTCTLSATEDHSVEAEFAPDTQYALTFSKTGGGQGSVKSKPSGLLCGYTCSSQVASYYSGEEVLITYKLNKGTTKLTWSTGGGTCTGSTEALEGTCTVPMSSAKTLVADFS